jgi:hypothetical protein
MENYDYITLKWSTYNASMGCTDSFDQRMSYFKTIIRKRTGWFWLYFISYKLWLRNNIYIKTNNLTRSHRLFTLQNFTEELVKQLCSPVNKMQPIPTSCQWKTDKNGTEKVLGMYVPQVIKIKNKVDDDEKGRNTRR